VEEVITEIRDSKSRELLNLMPFELHIRAPSAEAVKFGIVIILLYLFGLHLLLILAVEFAKKSGDYASLSRTDLKVLALSYMIEKEQNGQKYIRSSPAVKSFVRLK